MNQQEARTALAGATEAQMRLAKNIEGCPTWRHAAFGGVLAIFVGTTAVSSQVQMAGVAVGMGLAAWLFYWDRQRYGVFVNGYRKGATLPLTLALLGAMLVLIAIATWMRMSDLAWFSKLGLAAIAFALGTAASVKWQRVYLRELRSGKQ